MTSNRSLKVLIDDAAAIVGSYGELAKLIEVDPGNLAAMKNGRRPCNWRIRGKLRAILGEEPAAAFMMAMAEDLEASENPDEKKAAQQLAAIVEAFPEDRYWRKRRDSNPR